jgi:hypothetical protein
MLGSTSAAAQLAVSKKGSAPLVSKLPSVSPANLHSTNFSTITITITYHPELVQ